jgi:hypothetical protein
VGRTGRGLTELYSISVFVSYAHSIIVSLTVQKAYLTGHANCRAYRFGRQWPKLIGRILRGFPYHGGSPAHQRYFLRFPSCGPGAPRSLRLRGHQHPTERLGARIREKFISLAALLLFTPTKSSAIAAIDFHVWVTEKSENIYSMTEVQHHVLRAVSSSHGALLTRPLGMGSCLAYPSHLPSLRN